MAFDLQRALRRIRPQRFASPLPRRNRAELAFVGDPLLGVRELLLDTCVYVDVLQGHTPPELDALLQSRVLNHLSVCVAELVHAFGRLDPAHPSTRATLDRISQAVAGIPPHRLATAGTGVVAEAGILAGLVARLGGFQPGQEIAALNDAITFLHGLSQGYTVLTRNVRDFDLMNQVLPDGQVLFYERPRQGSARGPA